ncbi:MAG TPA: hypothetical protein DCO90_09280, partial [Sphingobacterium sp.]|nr:hypothetical protein [Sphingobacterium sp.]
RIQDTKINEFKKSYRQKMKTKILTAALVFSLTASFAQQPAKNKYQQYLPIIEKGTLVQKDSLANVLMSELKTYKSEEDYRTTINILRSLGKEDLQASAEILAKKKYPKGSLTRDAFITDVFYNASTPAQKEKAYNELIKKWPVKNFKEEPLTYDYVLANLA